MRVCLNLNEPELRAIILKHGNQEHYQDDVGTYLGM